MQRTITVKGIGNVSAKPDYVILSMSLDSESKDYDEAMSLAGEKINQLNETLASVGFEKDSVKTTNFAVHTDYESVKDRYGNRHSEFHGYVVHHDLKVSFDFESKRLSQALSAVAGCLSKPNLSIAFTVKDQTAVKEQMLISAAANAKRTAEILCQAYQVDQISIVLPTEIENLYIEDGKDYCTLMTCTPYGINTHRLLVRGTRIETDSAHIRVNAEAYKIDSILVALAIAVPVLLIILVLFLIRTRRKKNIRRVTP